jgi:formyltetrahydrofolate hydrolase
MPTQLLLITCPDQPGLVYKITGVLYHHAANVVSNHEFVDRESGQFFMRIINIHHSFLPAFIGANPYRQAFQRGVKIIGATAHYVTDELDMGPIIAQDVIPVTHADTARDMAQAGRDVEKIVLARALELVCEERVFLSATARSSSSERAKRGR